MASAAIVSVDDAWSVWTESLVRYFKAVVAVCRLLHERDVEQTLALLKPFDGGTMIEVATRIDSGAPSERARRALEASGHDVTVSFKMQSRSSARNQSCRLVSSTLPHVEQSAALTSQRPLAQSLARVQEVAVGDGVTVGAALGTGVGIGVGIGVGAGVGIGVGCWLGRGVGAQMKSFSTVICELQSSSNSILLVQPLVYSQQSNERPVRLFSAATSPDEQ